MNTPTPPNTPTTQSISSPEKLLPRRPDAKIDDDGHCTVCGCEIREYEGGTDAEALARHVCPPGFRTMPPEPWRPMATAPKDGTKILVISRQDVAIARWDPDTYAKKPRPFWRTDGPWGISRDRQVPPTGWLPCPAVTTSSSGPFPPPSEPTSADATEMFRWNGDDYPKLADLGAGWVLVAHPNGPAVTNGDAFSTIEIYDGETIAPRDVKLKAQREFIKWAWPHLTPKLRLPWAPMTPP